MKTGISLYLSGGIEYNQEIINHAQEAHMSYAFTSLQIPEEHFEDATKRLQAMLEGCKRAGIQLICDVSPEALQKLGLERLEELKAWGVSHIRLDAGFTAEETVKLSQTFQVVFNASTITSEDIAAWRLAGADFSRFVACHNFYPKQLTGLSLKTVEKVNARLSFLGFQIIAFVPGDKDLRGPLGEGLPTVESHRGAAGKKLIEAALELRDALVDVVIVGDPNLQENTWYQFNMLAQNYVEVQAQLEAGYEFLQETIHHDRPDSSEYIFRSQESRSYAKATRADIASALAAPKDFEADGSYHAFKDREPGTIWVSHEGYGRYAGEMEIARKICSVDTRLIYAGSVVNEDKNLLRLATQQMGVKLVQTYE